MINGLPCSQHTGFGAGLAATNDMAVPGIPASANLIALISWDEATGFFVGQDVTDFTVTAGILNAATIDLSSEKFVAIWTDAPAS